jgi:hypothetical protein
MRLGLLLGTSTSAPDSSLARISAPFVVVSVGVFFLQQIQVEFPAEEEALEWECLRAAESLQAEPAPLPPLAVAEAVSPLEELRGAERPQQQSRGVLTRLQVPSRNTMPEVAGK